MMLSSTAERLSRRPISKSPNAFRTIAEVACELDLPAHVLRFWETKFPQVKPLKRKGGRRYYRPEDVALLRQIRSLLHSEGYTIKGVQRLLREGGVKSPEPPAEAPVGTPERPSFADLDPAAPSPSGDGNKEYLRAVLSELLALRALLGNSEL